MAAFNDRELLSLLNTAQSIGALLNLGLTERQAQALLEYRQEHGSFSSVEEILQVKGIGERTLARLRLWGSAGGYPRSPRPAPRTKAETSPLTRPQGFLIGGLLALPLYFVIVSIANNGHGAFLAMAVIGSIIGFILLIVAIADLLVTTDSQNPRGSIALFAGTMVLGIVLALVMASGQLPVKEPGAPTAEGELSETPPLTAAFTVFPAGGEAPLTVRCDASSSRSPAGSTITEYQWRFDGKEYVPADVAGWLGEPEVSYTFTEPGQHIIELTIKDDQGVTATTQRVVTVAAPTRPSSPNPPPETSESLYITDSIYGFKDPEFLVLALSADTMDGVAAVVRMAHEMGACTLLSEGTRVVDVDSLVYPPWILIKVRVLSTGEEYWVPAQVVGVQE